MGHVSLATTNIYAEVDLEMKAKALANCEVKEDEPKKPWREENRLDPPYIPPRIGTS